MAALLGVSPLSPAAAGAVQTVGLEAAFQPVKAGLLVQQAVEREVYHAPSLPQMQYDYT